jgi:acyl-CoA hydrolase
VVETRYVVMPQHANDYGLAFGGTIMAWIDMVAAMVAQRHAEHEVVTVSTDKISFWAPIQIGDHVLLQASVNYVGRTSMEVGVRVTRENPYTGERVIATTAYLTFVGLDEHKKPVPVPGLAPETADEKRRHENARIRVQARKELLQKLKPGMDDETNRI